jgi:amidophosphoribosyltransferase
VDEIRASIGADSLAYVSVEGLTAATEQPAAQLCRACFTGEYSMDLPPVAGKYLLEGVPDFATVGEPGPLGEPPVEVVAELAVEALAKPLPQPAARVPLATGARR